MNRIKPEQAAKLGCPFSFNNPNGQAVSYKCITNQCLAWDEDNCDKKGYCVLIGLGTWGYSDK